MTTGLEQLLDEIAMQQLLSGETPDRTELTSLFEGLVSLAQAAQAESNAILAGAAERARSDLEVLPPEKRSTYLKAFISAAQVSLREPAAAKFPDASRLDIEQDISEGLDPELLVEFIEKHSTLMEEFEAALVQLSYRISGQGGTKEQLAEEISRFENFAKGYIHNIKGDAGSIGLVGIERICHHVEDILLERPLVELVEALLAFREWIGSCMAALAQGDAPVESASFFGGRFDQLACAKVPTLATPAPLLGDDLPPEANLDLLAELMAEVSTPTSAPANTGTESPASSTPVLAHSGTTPKPSSTLDYQLGGDPEVFVEFANEAEDHLAAVEEILLESQGQYSVDAIGSMFRCIHSIKGASSYFQLKEISETSHVSENLLDEVRDGKRAFDDGLTELMLNYVTLQRSLIKRAKQAFERSESTLTWQSDSKDYLAKLRAYEAGESTSLQRPAAADQEAKSSGASTVAASSADDGGEKGKNEKLEVKQFIKVDTVRLDQLIDVIGEMSIYSSMLVQTCRDLLAHDPRVSKTAHQVEKFARDLQGIGMSMRLVPIRGLFQKMSRLVWDVSKKIGKDIKFHMDGEDTELDRTIIDKLADPLMHMVRNALDHGVEPPDERVEKGKARTGNVWLSASYSGGNIHIKIRDDGRGLDPKKLVKKALEKGILTPEAAEKISPQDAYALIFAAGFSTAAVVTDISGRGVGMDVVRRNIESIRGRVHIDSEVAKGTTFTIELPLTLAIIDGIQVAVGKESFLVPTLSVIEFMRPDPTLLSRTLDRGETYQFRGRFLPVFRLGTLFQVPTKATRPEEGILVMVDAGGDQAAILVDAILGTCSTVIKGLGDLFEQGRGLSGCAIMANGEVALILDVRSLLSVAREGYCFEGDLHQRLGESVGAEVLGSR